MVRKIKNIIYNLLTNVINKYRWIEREYTVASDSCFMCFVLYSVRVYSARVYSDRMCSVKIVSLCIILSVYVFFLSV